MTDHDTSKQYKRTNKIDYLADFPGARRESDVIQTEVKEGRIDITDRAGRELGSVRVAELPEPVQTEVAHALDSNEQEFGDMLRVTSGEALDVTGEPVPLANKDGFKISPATESTLEKLVAKNFATESTLRDIRDSDSEVAGHLSAHGVSAAEYLYSLDQTQASESTLAGVETEAAAVADATAARGESSLTTHSDRAARSHTVPAGGIWFLDAAESWVVNHMTVNGAFDLDGTLEVYGDIDGSGKITGDGVIADREV